MADQDSTGTPILAPVTHPRLGIRYVDVGQASYPALVLLHGLGNSLFYWNAVLPLLAQNMRVIAPDIPGYGASRTPDTGFRLEAVSNNIADLLTDLEIRDAVIAGHSMGGAVAASLCVDHSSLTRGLILVNASLATAMRILGQPLTGLHHARVTVSLLAQILGGSIPMTRSGARLISHTAFLRSTLLKPFVANPRDVDEDTLTEALAHNRGRSVLQAIHIGRGLDIDALYGSVPEPIALIFGAADWLMGEEDITHAVESLAPISVTSLDGIGHWPMLEAPEAFSEALLDAAFLFPKGE